jgi:AcrR family transcriptional regulator
MKPTRVRRAEPPALPERLRPRKTPSQARSRALVDAILEAATRVLRQRGWHDATMARVAEVAGISIGSLYQYFPDKISLGAALIERQSERELAFHLERFAAIPPDAPLRALLRLLARTPLEFQALDRPLHRALLDAMAHVGRHALLVDRVRTTALGLRALLEQHRASVDHPDLDRAAHVIVNAVHSLTHDGALPRPDSMDDDALAEEVERLLVGYLRVQDAP